MTDAAALVISRRSRLQVWTALHWYATALERPEYDRERPDRVVIAVHMDDPRGVRFPRAIDVLTHPDRYYAWAELPSGADVVRLLSLVASEEGSAIT